MSFCASKGLFARRPAGCSSKLCVGSVQPPETLPGPSDEADGTLVVFGRGYSSEILQGSLDAFAEAVRKAST